jgi:hypothetical protein
MELSITNSGIYNFLHALLHYFHCLHENIDAKEGRHMLFKEIFDLDYVQRKKYDYDIPIKQTRNMKPLYLRERFKVDSSFLELSKTHSFPRKMLGNVFLRCARTKQSEDARRFMNSEKHILLIERIEKFIGSTLPAILVYDILFFQSTEEGIFKVLDDFIELRDEIIKKHLYDFSIPPDLYRKLLISTTNFMDQFTFIMPELQQLNERTDIFTRTINHINLLMRFTTYPKCLVSFCELIPTEVNKEKFVFIKNDIINHLRPLLSDIEFSFSPSWHVRWEFNQKFNIYEMVVLLTNPFHNNISCSFRVPLRIPIENELESSQLFELISSLVDGLGSEALKEEEEIEFKLLNLKSKPIPQYSIPDFEINFSNQSANQSIKSNAGKKNLSSSMPIA